MASWHDNGGSTRLLPGNHHSFCGNSLVKASISADKHDFTGCWCVFGTDFIYNILLDNDSKSVIKSLAKIGTKRKILLSMIVSLAAKMNKRLLLIAAVLATVSSLVSGQADFAFYKFGLHWPPSVCNDPDGYECKPDVLNDFYIHGLWPHYANGQRVPPYDPDTNKCSDPVYPDQIVGKLESIRDYLTKLWPNFKDYESQQANENFWKYEWKIHGMCSDYFDNPYMYFRSGLFLGSLYSNPLNGTNIKPRFAPYQAREIIEALKDKFGVYPEIGCNQVKGVLQLREIHLCFERDTQNPPSVLQDCPFRYTGKCKNGNDRVRFTPHLIGG